MRKLLSKRMTFVYSLLSIPMMVVLGASSASAAATLQGTTLDFNMGGSSIVENGNLVVKTDDLLTLNAGSQVETTSDLKVGGRLIIANGDRDDGTGIYKDGDLHITTGDQMWFDAGTVNARDDLVVGDDLTIKGDLVLRGALDLPVGSVTSTMLLNGTVATADLAGSSVTSAKIADATIAAADLAADIAITTTGAASFGDVTVGGGELYVTGVASSASTTEGTIYYDTDDDNLYVYANGSFVDLTAGAAGSNTLDDAYNTSAGASTVLVDNGDLILRSNAAGSDIIVDLASTGDFIFQDNGTDVVTFNDSGSLTMASGTLALNNDTVTSDGDLSITGATGANLVATTGDLDLTSSAGSVVITGAEAAADAITLNASDAAGGIDIDAGTGTIDVLQTGTVAGDGITIATTDGGVAITAAGAANGDMTLTVGDDFVANVTGIWDNNTTGAVTVDTAAGISLDGATASNFTVTGASEDLTLGATGGSIVATATEDAADAIVINASAGGVDVTAATYNVDIVATTLDVNITGETNVDVAATSGDVTVASGDDILNTAGDEFDVTATGLVDINAGASMDVDVTGAYTMDATTSFSIDGAGTASNVTLAADGDNDDLTVAVTGAHDASLILQSAGTGADAVKINASAGGIDIDADDGIAIDAAGTAGEDIVVTNTGGSIILSATESAADSVQITSTAGGIDIAASGAAAGEDIDITTTGSSVNISSTENATDAVTITASAGGINIAATGAATEDITLVNTGGSIGLSATEDAADAITIATTAGGMDITVAGDTAGDDLDIVATGTATEIRVTSASATVDAISLQASAGGIDIDAANEDLALTVTSDGAGDDLTLTQVGANDSSIVLTAAGTGADAISLQASAGGFDIDAAAASTISTSNDEITIATGTADVVLTGSAIGTAALTVTAGDVTLTSGNFTQTAGTVYLAVTTAGAGAGNDETLDTTNAVNQYDAGGASRTGVILEAPTANGQIAYIINISDAAENITFAAVGTSNVANGVTSVIGQNEAMGFVAGTVAGGDLVWFPMTSAGQ